MKARQLIETATALEDYLTRCQQRNHLAESAEAHVPPTAAEVRELFSWLRQHKLEATIVGSVGVLHHLKAAGTGFRPTVDLDLFVPVSHEALRKVPPAPGWKVDTKSLGVISWISPTGGYVDFLTARHHFADGSRTPAQVTADPSSAEWPVATPVDLFRLKLGSMRDKDLTDLVSLARATGRIPTQAELGPLNQTQGENLALIHQWIALRP